MITQFAKSNFLSVDTNVALRNLLVNEKNMGEIQLRGRVSSQFFKKSVDLGVASTVDLMVH